MRISVIICTYTEERLADTLYAVERLLAEDDPDLQVILVVDRNRELHAKLLGLLDDRVQLLFSERPGLSAGRNVGLQTIEDGVVAFLDDDAYPEPGWLDLLRRGYRDPRVMGVGGRIVAHWYGSFPRWYPKEIYWIIGCTYRGHPTRRGPIRNTFGSNISFRIDLLREAGWFDEKLGRVDEKNYTAEEMEMCLRMAEAHPDMVMLFEPKAIVRHRIYLYRLSLGFTWRRSFYEGISKARVAMRRRNALGTESSYLKVLVRAQFGDLGRLVALRRPLAALSRLALRDLVVFAVGSGYLLTRLRILR